MCMYVCMYVCMCVYILGKLGIDIKEYRKQLL